LAIAQASCRDLADRLAAAEARAKVQEVEVVQAIAEPDEGSDTAPLHQRIRELEQAHEEAYARWSDERRELNEQWEAHLRAELAQAREETAHLREQVEALQGLATQTGSPDQQEAVARHQQLADARRKMEKLREQVHELETRASQAATLDADLREARDVIARQQAELAKAGAGNGPSIGK